MVAQPRLASMIQYRSEHNVDIHDIPCYGWGSLHTREWWIALGHQLVEDNDRCKSDRLLATETIKINANVTSFLSSPIK